MLRCYNFPYYNSSLVISDESGEFNSSVCVCVFLLCMTKAGLLSPVIENS